VRIVGGTARGRRLVVPPDGTRPTSDRAREGLFNALAALLDIGGARMLDLFAGTGAVGLEALSRGAQEAVLVESGRRAGQVLERNVTSVGVPGAHVVARPVQAYLADPPTAPFDFVFADPPYALPDADLAQMVNLLGAPGWLVSGAIVVIERSARGSAPAWSDYITPVQKRRYGEGVLWYGRRR
jgi:16S rRNA (guanine966-N2)-methyltransferase